MAISKVQHLNLNLKVLKNCDPINNTEIVMHGQPLKNATLRRLYHTQTPAETHLSTHKASYFVPYVKDV
jgi:hypothetical protein